MDRWQAACDAAGIHPDAAYADHDGRARLARRLHAAARRGHAARAPRRRSCPTRSTPNPLAAALELALGDADRGRPSTSSFYASPADYEAHRDTIEGLRARTATLQVKLLPDGALPLLAAQVASDARPSTCCRAPTRRRSSFGSRLQQWRLPAALAAATAGRVRRRPGLSALAAARRPRRQLDAADRPGLRAGAARAESSSIRARRCRACWSARRRRAARCCPRVGAGAGDGTDAAGARRVHQLPRRRARPAAHRAVGRGARRHQAGHEPGWLERRTAVRDAARPDWSKAGCRSGWGPA